MTATVYTYTQWKVLSIPSLDFSQRFRGWFFSNNFLVYKNNPFRLWGVDSSREEFVKAKNKGSSIREGRKLDLWSFANQLFVRYFPRVDIRKGWYVTSVTLHRCSQLSNSRRLAIDKSYCHDETNRLKGGGFVDCLLNEEKKKREGKSIDQLPEPIFTSHYFFFTEECKLHSDRINRTNSRASNERFPFYSSCCYIFQNTTRGGDEVPFDSK